MKHLFIKLNPLSILAAVILVVVQTGCDTNNQSYGTIPVINFEKALNNQHQLKLSDFVESIKIIPLETSSNSLIGRSINKVICYGDYLFVSQYNNPLFIFNSEGEFLRSVGSIGRGPEELPAGYSFTFNGSDSTLIINNPTKTSLAVYSLNGEYLRDIRIGERLLTINLLSYDTCFSQLNLPYDNDKEAASHIIFNIEGEVINRYKTRLYIPEAQSHVVGEVTHVSFPIVQPVISIDSEVVNFYTGFNDTLFSIGKDGVMRESLAWQRGTFNPSIIRAYLQGMGKIGSFWFFRVPIPEATSDLFLYNEKDGQLSNITEVLNDINGTVTSLPLKSEIYNNTWASAFTTAQLKKMLEDGAFQNKQVSQPEKRKKFIEMVSQLDDNDNPVIIVYTLKPFS